MAPVCSKHLLLGAKDPNSQLGWLIKSNYEPDDAPGFEILLNKEKALDWSHFDLELVFPVKKMKGT